MIFYFFKNPTTSGQAPHDLSKEKKPFHKTTMASPQYCKEHNSQ
jgi:hypothetical protein